MNELPLPGRELVVHDYGWKAYTAYLSLELNEEVEAHLITDPEVPMIAKLFDVGIFKAGDYLVRWRTGRTACITPEIFALKYRKTGEAHGQGRPEEPRAVDGGAPDQDRLPPREAEHPGDARELPQDERGGVDEVPAARGEAAGEVRELGLEHRIFWKSCGEARSFALEMLHALNHPEELERPLDEEESAAARVYIRSAKEFLAAHDEYL